MAMTVPAYRFRPTFVDHSACAQIREQIQSTERLIAKHESLSELDPGTEANLQTLLNLRGSLQEQLANAEREREAARADLALWENSGELVTIAAVAAGVAAVTTWAIRRWVD